MGASKGFGKALGLAGLLATACASGQVTPGAAAPPQPSSVSALYVLDTGILGDAYVADSTSGLIYHADTFRNSLREPIPPLKVFTRPSLIKQPLDLASQDDDLFVLDGVGPRIIELHTAGDTDEVTEGPWLAGASRFAISPQGRVAVYATGPDGSRLEIGQLEHDRVTPLLTVSKLPFAELRDMQFSDEDLLVLEGRQIYTTPLAKPSPSPATGELTWQRISFSEDFRGFAVYRGTFYLIGDQPAVYVPAAELAVPLPSALIPRARQVAVTRTELLFTTDDNRLEQVARPVPVSIEITGSERDATAAAVQLYGYLLQKDLMAATELKSSRPYPSLAQLLAEAGWLAHSLAPVEPAYKKLNELLCFLNPCKVSDVLGAPVAAGETWSVPASKLEGTLTLEPASLTGGTVQDLLRERFPDERERRDFTEDYLRRINNMTEEEWPQGGSPPKGRTLVLPRRKWLLTALVYRPDLAGRGPLRFEGIAGVRVLSLEEVGVKRGCFEAVGSDETWEARAARRAYAAALIENVDPPDNGGTLTPIAVAEAPIDKSHPAFCDADGKTLWWSVGQQFEREKVSCRPGNAEFHSYDPNNADHGSAVAGLIAGREVRGIAGLLRSAKLIQFDVDGLNASRFGSQIDAAILKGEVKLFNFSNLLEKLDEEDVESFKTKVASTPALFVVAAGNEGRRMTENLAKPLAKYSALKNVLVVGASNPCDDVLKEAIEAERRIPGSNWGQLVHLVAPGFGMLAPGENGGYTEIGGTSLASALVTAAAGNLLSRKLLTPSVVKARLMYTADWSNQYIEDEVVGGRLNIRRAVSHLDSYLVRNTSNPKQLFEVKPDYSQIPWLKGSARDRSGNWNALAIKWSRVLRLTGIAGGRHRVIFVDDSNRFNVVNVFSVDASSDVIPCTAGEWSEEAQAFKPTADSAALCTGGSLRASNIMDYVAPVPSGEIGF